MAFLLCLQVIGSGLLGCGPLPDDALDSEVGPFQDRENPLQASNGLSPNGIITNGIITNGLSPNGIITNGLSTHGLSTLGVTAPSFSTWFDSNPADFSDMVMKYVVACAYGTDARLTYLHPTTGITYTWHGVLGLTPGWARGQAITRDEEQLITACLAAHVNKFGIHMDISVRGVTATGAVLSVTDAESTEFKEREAAFFGNLFTDDGIFACNDSPLSRTESSARACGLAAQASGTSVECPPMQHLGNCATTCTLARGGGYYESCTINGKRYTPITTRIRPADIYRCGDGICQVSESCDPDLKSTNTTYNACESDCGNCPR